MGEGEAHSCESRQEGGGAYKREPGNYIKQIKSLFGVLHISFEGRWRGGNIYCRRAKKDKRNTGGGERSDTVKIHSFAECCGFFKKI